MPSAYGSTIKWTSPNWPAPPLCFLWRYSAFACLVIVSRYGIFGSLKITCSFSLFSKRHFNVRRWNSPWPWTMVCFNSLLCSTTHVGSSWRIFNKAAINFSVSCEFFASTAREYLELGYLMKSKRWSIPLPFRVLPVFTSFIFTAQPKSPAFNWSTAIRLAPAQA